MERIKKITGIKAGKNKIFHRSSIFLNNDFAFSLDNEIISREQLKVGLELSDERIEGLVKSDAVQKCLNSALRYLTYRPRSEAEIRNNLRRKQYTDEEIDNTVKKLKKMRLLDDNNFADFWKENRNEFKPLSKLMVKHELRLKGIDGQIIDAAVEDMNDEENAYQAAIKKSETIKTADYNIFYRKLGSYLQRRGFNFAVINKTVNKIWKEKQEDREISS